MLNCSTSNWWIGDDFAPCFRETAIDGLIPALTLLWALVAIAQKVWQWRRASSSVYTPLKTSQPAFGGYGSTQSTLPTTAAEQEDDDEADDSSSQNTVSPSFSEQAPRWTFFNVVRFVSVVQLGFYVNALVHIKKDTYDFDAPVEGSIASLTLAYAAQATFWGVASLLTLANLVLATRSKLVTNEIAYRLNFFYFVVFFVGLVDLHSYYMTHFTESITTGYAISLWTTSITLALIVLIINEARNASKDPIITESGRELSGENWASLYSQFMFSWVRPMMIEGYKRTLNDKDLLELPSENRAKNVLSSYRKVKTPSMTWSILKTFQWPLFKMFLYSMVWSVGIFGPPLFLNKIVKYIENDPDYRALPSSAAFLFVLGLFLTNVLQSLSMQQALYIGRTLGIRVQAIVIGEVFSKSLRRRDTASAPKDDAPSDEQKTKTNVNNLLSVDAQKLGEITAYVFYVYSYPVQIGISIWCLYELLGMAALWGVLVMVLTQPLTFFVSQKFEKKHNEVMTATDKRIKTVNELLSAIRVVKFFAWEKEFRKRVTDARQNELKAIRGRLFMFMHMGNTWFMIPILIMATVFYVYTLHNDLTASTAFTALALFYTFRAALDELPMLISFLLQANVAIKRIENFLDEDEVELPPEPTSTDRPYIGFVDNASFSWDKPSAEPSQPPKLALKNLNLSFPRNKLSIVCGSTGSGKTTLISSLLGETHCVSGAVALPRIIPNRTSPLGGAVSGIAYVAQTAWLQNCSIRDNILFGLPFDEDRYEQVLYMTALTRDLEILEFGDSTEVGEKGITLSGGQKQRVAIARAVYSQATTVIFDDCLSAVDAHTAKHLYEFCLTGPLMRDRTVILVTHHVGLCIKGAAYVVLMSDGEVKAAGEPRAMVKSGVLGDELARAEEQRSDEKEEAVTDGPIPTVPKKLQKKQQDGAGKLTKEEERAEGSVSWSVYQTYLSASGGWLFWVLVVILFAATQGIVLGQDYWIKVWAAAYSDKAPSDSVGAFATTTSGTSELGMFGITYLRPFADIMAKQEVDVKYYLVIYFLIGVVALIMSSLRSLILFIGSLNASRRIHAQLLEKILRAKVRFYDTTPIGRIVNRFSSDMETIDQAIAPTLSFLLFSIVNMFCVIVLVTVITPTFVVPGVIIAILYWLIGSYYLATSRDLKRLNSVTRSPIYVQFNESVNGVMTIRAYGCQQRFLNENYDRVDSNNRPFIWMWATNRWLHARVETLGAFVGFCTGFVLVMSRDWVDPGLAGLSLSYALTFTHHVLWVIRMYAVNEMNLNAVERVHEYLTIDEEPPVHIPETCPPPSWPESGAVKVENLVMQYAPENPPVLRDVSFEVKPREKVGIVGRTGSGKSTLALSIFRFMEPTSGRIIIDGVDIGTIGLEDLRSRLTIIPQDPVLFSGTLRSNLDPFDQYDDAAMWAALKRSHLVDSDAQDITLDAPVSENGNNWSQGQRQLIALARALIKKSTLIVLDEATSSVDFDTDHKIQQTIREEFHDSALLVIAHRIRTVADYDRILVLDHGKLVEFDTPYTLMTREGGVFRSMCERSGEYPELLAIATAKHNSSQ